MDTPEIARTSLRDFLHVLFKRKMQVVLFFGATVCSVGIGTLLVKPTYEAISQILIKVGRENIYVPTVPTSGNLNPVFSFNREEQINSEIEILKSRFLAEKVVGSLGPATIYPALESPGRGIAGHFFGNPDTTGRPAGEKALLKLQKALTVESVKKSEVIDVSFRHQDPQMAATVVNTLVNLYLDHHLQVHKTPQSYDFFREQSQILRKRLEQSEEALEIFKTQHDVTSLEEERSLLLKQEADLRTALNQTLSQGAETENRIHQLRSQLATTPQTVPLDEEINQNPYTISTLQTKLVELELREHELLSKYTEQSRLVQNVRQEIQTVKEKLAEQEATQYGKTRSGVNKVYQDLHQELLRSQADMKALKAKEETQQAHLADYQKELAKLSGIEKELNHLTQQVEVDRQNYRLYLTKFEESRISDAMDTEKIANVSVIEPARPPLKPVSPKVALNMVLAVFLGGFGGLGLAFFVEYLDDSLEKTDQVEECLELPVLATIPEIKK
jgi:uncharacterized protein involved in exopolysaccharide biosynthesis